MFNKKMTNFFTHKDIRVRDDRWIFTIVLIGAILSLLAAFVLSVDAIELAKNPNVQLSCSVNVVINCATVAKSQYSALLGFPNSFIGMMTEPVMIVIAVAGLAMVRFPRWFMFGVQIMATMSLAFAYYLLYVSSFIIQALCPWCLLVTFSTTLVFFSISRYNIREENLYLSGKISQVARKLVERDFDRLAMALIIVLIIAGIITKYGSALFA